MYIKFSRRISLHARSATIWRSGKGRTGESGKRGLLPRREASLDKRSACRMHPSKLRFGKVAFPAMAPCILIKAGACPHAKLSPSSGLSPERPCAFPPPRVVLKSTGGMGTGSSCSLEKSARHWNTLRRALPFGGALPVNARAGRRQNPIYSVLVHKTASIRCTSQSRFHNIVPENEPLLKSPFV